MFETVANPHFAEPPYKCSVCFEPIEDGTLCAQHAFIENCQRNAAIPSSEKQIRFYSTEALVALRNEIDDSVVLAQKLMDDAVQDVIKNSQLADFPWHKFGERSDVDFDELADVGRVLLGGCPRVYEWVQISADRSAYRIGPKLK